MKSRVHPTYKTKYHVQNCASYDRALVSRGDITIWLSPTAIAAWEPDRAGTRGAQRKYSDVAVETALTLRLLFHLPLRQAEGFLTSLFVLMGLDLQSPDHTGVIVAHALTDATVDDATTGIELIKAVNADITRVTADAAYDTVAFYEAAGARSATVVVPPARLRRHRPVKYRWLGSWRPVSIRAPTHIGARCG